MLEFELQLLISNYLNKEIVNPKDGDLTFVVSISKTYFDNSSLK